jgi:lysyl-tRNA synthetase class 1
MREVLTGDAIHRALLDAGQVVRFNYVADNYDPLRKVYPFLDPGRYGPLVGRPISDIPCPCEGHASYADHFLEPFLVALEELRVDVEVVRADELYKSGRMTPLIIRALTARDRIAEILHELTGKPQAADWSPFSPICGACHRSTGARVVGFSADAETVHYRCDCGSEGELPMAGGGKLVWRIDWAARWKLLEVSIEPFGKDHATRGGSYDTGVRIIREVFDGEPPFPIPYEWIRLKGQGDMSSSKGNVLSISRILEVAPPEALRYLVIRERPQRTISFDPGLPLLQLVDQLDDAAAAGRDARSIELSRAGGFEPVGVPYKHLVVVAQAASFDVDRTVEILRRTGYPEVTTKAVADRMRYAERWLETFAPEDLKFRIQQELPAATADLTDVQRQFLGRLAERLDEPMQGEKIQELIFAIASEFEGVGSGPLFQSIYVALLGKPRGPRAGWFIAVVGPRFASERFEQAAGGQR